MNSGPGFVRGVARCGGPSYLIETTLFAYECPEGSKMYRGQYRWDDPVPC